MENPTDMESQDRSTEPVSDTAALSQEEVKSESSGDPGLPGDKSVNTAPAAERTAAAASVQEDPEVEPRPVQQRPALTITIQSWVTPLLGLVMLIVGLVGGYLLRPVIVQTAEATAVEPSPQPSPNPQTQRSAEDRAALMNSVLPNVRHFKGNPNATITLIEFSDFQ